MLTSDEVKRLRRKVIALARRRQQPGIGSSYAFLTRRTATVQWYDLSKELGEIRWAVVGAVATRHYMPERTTKNLDVVIAAADAALARRQFQNAEFNYQRELSSGRSKWITSDGQEIDLIEGTESWWAGTLQEAQSNRDLQGLPVLPLPYLVLMKFQASRLQDIADLSRMLGQASGMQLAAVRATFQKLATSDDLEDLESIIALGQLETENS